MNLSNMEYISPLYICEWHCEIIIKKWIYVVISQHTFHYFGVVSDYICDMYLDIR